MFTEEDFKLGSTKTNGLRYLTIYEITFRIVKTNGGFWRGSILSVNSKVCPSPNFDLTKNAVMKGFLEFMNDAEESEAIRRHMIRCILY